MNVDAMIKHHQAVTEVITHAMSDYASAATGTSWNKACFAFEADAILCALSRAGFRIIGPDEVDQVTLERAELACFHQQSKIHERKRTEWDRGNDSAVNGCIHAIRALGKGERDAG